MSGGLYQAFFIEQENKVESLRINSFNLRILKGKTPQIVSQLLSKVITQRESWATTQNSMINACYYEDSFYSQRRRRRNEGEEEEQQHKRFVIKHQWR